MIEINNLLASIIGFLVGGGMVIDNI